MEYFNSTLIKNVFMYKELLKIFSRDDLASVLRLKN
jgi:hypothetical protein